MKKLILFIFLSICVFYSCEKPKYPKSIQERIDKTNERKLKEPSYPYKIVEIDSCEYIEVNAGYYKYSLTRKCDCKHCKEKNRDYVEILTDLVTIESIDKKTGKITTIDTMVTLVKKDGSSVTMTKKEFRKKYNN